MSIEALVWAFRTPLRPATHKLVLIALADSANSDGEMWSSLAHLIDKTSLDRKTIIDALDALEDAGLLADTGKRVGATKQIKVYSLAGLDCGDRHYVYRVTDDETGEFYIGVRSCACSPEDDSAYRGSGKWPLLASHKGRPLSKVILEEFETRAEADVAEMRHIAKHSANPLIRNLTGAERQRIPKTGLSEGFRFSHERVPKTEHGTQRNQYQKKEPPLPPKVTFDGRTLHVPDPIVEALRSAHPTVNVDAEIAKASTWCYLNPSRRPASQFGRFLNGWCSRAAGRAPEPVAPSDRRQRREQFAASFFDQPPAQQEEAHVVIDVAATKV